MAKISGSDIRPGMVIEHDGSRAPPPRADARGTGAANVRCPRRPLARRARQRGRVAVKTSAVKPGKGPAYNQVELKNVLDGRKLNQRFGGSDRVDETEVERRQFQFLCKQGDQLIFMDTTTYDQIELSEDFVGERSTFLQDGMNVQVRLHQDRPIGIKLPETVVLAIVEADAPIKGQTATSSYKSATLENGLRIQVPPFIGSGEKVVVSTDDVAYVRRAD